MIVAIIEPLAIQPVHVFRRLPQTPQISADAAGKKGMSHT
jgi:hypothetical protein